MNEELLTDALLREFLLGALAGDERQRIESLLQTDSQARERLLIAEQDLIEDYLEDSLTYSEKERFLSLYTQTDEQRRKLRITKSIKDWALTEGRVSQTVPATVPLWSRLRRRLRGSPIFVVPIAVTIVIVIVLGIVWSNSRREQRKHLAVEQELAQLNSSTSLSEVPEQMISLELRPVTVRSVAPQAELNPGAGVRLVELRLPWIQKERYSTYQAELRRLSDNELFTIRNVVPATDRGYLIRVRLPPQILSRGSYRIDLRGISADGATGTAEEYNFFVSG